MQFLIVPQRPDSLISTRRACAPFSRWGLDRDNVSFSSTDFLSSFPPQAFRNTLTRVGKDWISQRSALEAQARRVTAVVEGATAARGKARAEGHGVSLGEEPSRERLPLAGASQRNLFLEIPVAHSSHFVR